MSELKQCEQEHEANALRINAGRKPKFGDMMRNPWAGESNPQRDGYFVRERRQGGRFNPGHYYEFTDKCGKFWETNAKYAFFIDTQPEATKPAQDLGAAILALPLPGGSAASTFDPKEHVYSAWQMRELLKDAAALASPADALVAGDSETAKDAERYRFLRDHGVPETDAEIEKALTVYQGVGLNSLLPDELDSAIDAAIQAQKDGHG